MWYVSGNRDEDAIERPNAFIIDRPARQHLSFGSAFTAAWATALRRCSLRVILVEEDAQTLSRIIDSGRRIRVYLKSSFIHGIRELPVRIPRLKSAISGSVKENGDFESPFFHCGYKLPVVRRSA